MSFFIVGLSGMLGAVSRYLVGAWTAGWWELSFPLGTLVVNFIGCMGLGVLNQYLLTRNQLPAWFTLGAGTGFIGSFTTFSTFSVETLALWHQHQYVLAICYVLASLWGGLMMAWFGSLIGARLTQRGSDTDAVE
ncbi:fluoride efflux transporter CrcB [Brevibacillus laterosporus]|uniref:fluoride efflux transporter CrcB n=1 Tax=Brevibacillus laterosporus TaxID=1465 RepID=UPI002652A7AB|nr:fluoride efflux transporter CrcB [Brevibacillus laterosporus]MDN9012651.1 fluoride efflux transporter CrcB [Brevibacillus laterosporus]MDO0943726.1 fluoride efflux transporter CrcB [Brevibacillus laterosporus]